VRIIVTLDRDSDASEGNDYVRALTAAGAPRESIVLATPDAPALGRFDGLVLGGGIDVDPARFGRPKLPGGRVELDAERDALDFALLERARADGVPVLGICRGLQVVNVALGGTLVQDIPLERPSSVVHERESAQKTRLDHEVTVVRGSRLAAIAGDGPLAVNSRHHQAIDSPAPGVTVSGVAPDGVAEALEVPDAWLLAVQWHPENLTAADAPSARLFEAFLRAVRERTREI
jgi:putative glutamine amidotransferase